MRPLDTSRIPRSFAVLTLLGALALAAAPLSSAGGVSSKKGVSSKVVRGPRAGQVVRVKAVALIDRVKPKNVGVPLKPGYRFVAIRLVIQNLGTRRYKSRPASTATAGSKAGHGQKALLKGGLKPVVGVVVLAPKAKRIGYLTFEVKEGVSVRRFTFRPFGKRAPRISLFVEE
jgi:hypothetical protein